MILNKNFFDSSDFESTFLQRVRSVFKNITTRQILSKKLYNVLDLESTF